MILIAMSTLIKCIYMCIAPYENGILPAFATALAYSPMLCAEITSSV